MEAPQLVRITTNPASMALNAGVAMCTIELCLSCWVLWEIQRADAGQWSRYLYTSLLCGALVQVCRLTHYCHMPCDPDHLHVFVQAICKHVHWAKQQNDALAFHVMSVAPADGCQSCQWCRKCAGSLPACWRRIFRWQTQIVYIESIARVDSLSLSGKILYHLRMTDAFFVQWPHLQERFPRSRCCGSLY